MEFLIVGIGGFIGAIARYCVYLVERAFGAHSFPFGTLIINMLGCIIAGILMALIELELPIQRYLVLLGSVGLIGSFTTFSALSVESLQLIRSNQLILALINIATNSIFGIGAVYVGRALMLRHN